MREGKETGHDVHEPCCPASPPSLASWGGETRPGIKRGLPGQNGVTPAEAGVHSA